MRSRTARHLGILGFVFAAGFLALVGWTSYHRLGDLREAHRRVDRTLEVRTEAEIVLSLLKDAETGQRGFLISGDASYLQPYETAVASLPRRLARLRELTADDPGQQKSLVALEALIPRKLDELSATIAARKRRGLDAAARIVLTDEGKSVMDRIRAVVATIRDEEERNLSERKTFEAREARVVTYTTIGSLALALALVLAATALLNKAVRERAREHVGRTTAEALAAALADSEERLRVTIASIGDAVIATDEQGRVTMLNPIAEALTGWSSADASGRPLQDVLVIINEASRRQADNPVERALREGVITGLANHTLLVAKGGREIPIDDSAAPIKTADGRLVGAVMVFRDVSERRRVERERAALLEQERRARSGAERLTHRLRHIQAVTDATLIDLGLEDLLRQLLARVRLALGSDTATVLLLDDDGTHLTPAASDGLGEDAGEATRIPVGHGVEGKIAASDDGLIFDDLAAVPVVNPFLPAEVKSLVGVPLRIGKRLIGVIHVGAATPWRFTSDDLELLRLVAERAALAVERARLLVQEQQARQEAEAANRMKDDFLAILSHELRTPLTSIVGWTRMLRANVLDEETRRRGLEVIERSVNVQTRLIDDLLDVSSFMRGDVRLELRPLDLFPILEAAVDAARATAEPKRLTLDRAFGVSAVPIAGDPDRLQQVVANLLTNAIKFTPAGGRVTIRLERADPWARVTVSDSGRGISAGFLPHVFESFRQGEGAREHGGLGLGLAIVRRLVELHGGTVHAESAGEGKGATFTVALPLIDRSAHIPR
ncbi:MAG TPA: CHASE3 domain-containing protein [Methylomirabilota bacterium]|nr:CHASE3 domain-containing protein [Methylomirabilota bacterium]